MWKLDCEEGWAPKNWCFWIVVLEKSLESPLDCKGIQPVHSERDQPWDFFGRNDAKAETPVLWPPHAELTYWKRFWCWEGLGAGGEGDDRGWDGWMASLTRWPWVWVNSGSWWWTGRPGVLWFMGSQRVGHNWVNELNWTEVRERQRLDITYIWNLKKDTNELIYKTETSDCIAEGALLNVMWQPGWDRGLGENGYMHVWLSPLVVIYPDPLKDLNPLRTQQYPIPIPTSPPSINPPHPPVFALLLKFERSRVGSQCCVSIRHRANWISYILKIIIIIYCDINYISTFSFLYELPDGNLSMIVH